MKRAPSLFPHFLAIAIASGLALTPPQGHAFLGRLFKKKPPVVPEASEMGAVEATADAIFQTGAQAEANGDTKAAAKAYQQAVDKYPLTKTAAKAQFQIGEIELAKGDLDAAFEAFDIVISSYRSSPQFSSAIGRQFEIAEAAKSGKKVTFIGIPMKVTRSRTIEMYNAVISNAPFGTYAPKAQFSIGEIYQGQNNAPAAINAYQRVVDDYPRSELAKDAQFRIGQINNLTALRSQDVGSLRDAQSAMQAFVINNPEAEEASEARTILGDLELRDLGREMEIARFYQKTNKPKAAAIYYQGVIAQGDSPYLNEAQERLAALEEADTGGEIPTPPKPPAAGTKKGPAAATDTTNLVKASPRYAGPRAPDLDKLLKKPAPRLSPPTKVIGAEEDGDLPEGKQDASNILLPPPPKDDGAAIPPAPETEGPEE